MFFAHGSMRRKTGVGQALYREVEQLGHDQLVLDFSDVRHFSSALLAVLIELNKRINASGSAIIVRNGIAAM